MMLHRARYTHRYLAISTCQYEKEGHANATPWGTRSGVCPVENDLSRVAGLGLTAVGAVPGPVRCRRVGGTVGLSCQIGAQRTRLT